MSYYILDDLEVYQLAETFSNEIWLLVSEWNYFAKETVGKQIVRSADSIGANIDEGYGRYHYKENRDFCYFSRGSILATKGWLIKSRDRDLIPEEQFQALMQKLQTIHLKLNAYLKFIGTKSGQKTDQ
ncbi:four helix bundle protein [Mucilaginibacter sp. HC2]|uniref:four helix bundle protein n=1 Tax=Mucilaginibacter inviolabilis TaxID=2714892 RepID=UPI00140C031E|nr:four helix bundle protein [Mucilaginibacter inviolabilis]NHA05229.1 four helix bundle protein [Mucilaginibacter inviolabilis]